MAFRPARLPTLPSDEDLEGGEDHGLLEKEEAGPERRPTQRETHQYSNTWLRCVTAISGLLNVLLGGVIAFLLWQRFRPSFRKQELAGDVNGIWPKLDREIVEFQPDNRYVGNLTSPNFKNQTHDVWLELVPKGLGFISVPYDALPSYPSLPTPYIKYDEPVYTTSATHQLHCLYMIMTGMNELALNDGRFVPMDMSSSSSSSSEEHNEGLTREGEDPAEHIAHCFDYLRQAIMCHGDTALEGLQTTFGPDVGGSDGWNVQHVCKKWDQVYDWLEENRIDDRVWI